MAEGIHMFAVTPERLHRAMHAADKVVQELRAEPVEHPDMLLLVAAMLIGTHCATCRVEEPFPQEAVEGRLVSITTMVAVVQCALDELRASVS